MDLIGLVDSITNATAKIDFGRKGFATRGMEQEGRISYEKGIAEALSAFQKAQTAADPQALILAEYTFLTQELQFCDKSDTDTFSSLTQALQSFDDAFLALKVVEGAGYKAADETYPHHKKYRVSGCPKDSFHIARCLSARIAHRTRLQNIIRTPGLDQIEKSLLKQRLANLTAAQGGYVEKQKKSINN